MNTKYTESELSLETNNLLTELCGCHAQTNRIQDDFGDTSWLDEFIEDFIGG